MRRLSAASLLVRRSRSLDPSTVGWGATKSAKSDGDGDCRAGRLRWDDVKAGPQDNERLELFDGELVVTSGKERHECVVMRIVRALFDRVVAAGGRVFYGLSVVLGRWCRR